MRFDRLDVVAHPKTQKRKRDRLCETIDWLCEMVDRLCEMVDWLVQRSNSNGYEIVTFMCTTTING